MKSRLFPVMLIAAATSVATIFAVNHFQPTSHFGPGGNSPVPVNYASYNGTSPSSAGAVNFEAAAASSIKAVVHIKTATQARVVTDNSSDLFTQLFGQRQYYIPSQVGSGSGVIISPDGYIVTNNHVVADANEVTVTFNDRYTAKAKVIGTDPSTDIAVIKIDGEKSLPFMEFGNSDDVRLGQWVLAVGFPLNLDATVTAGIVSAKGRSLGINKAQSAAAIESFIQTDAAVNPGNSGGALVNTGGQLIGINSAIASPTGSYAGYSYAIPSNIVHKVANDLMKYGSVQRGYLGINFIDSRMATPEQVAQLGLDKSDGVYVASVMSNSGAAKAGLQKGDFITQINGTPVNSQPELQGQVARYQPGDNISVTYVRSGKPYTTTIQLTNLNGTTDIIKAQSPAKLLGASFRPLTDKERGTYGIDKGVLVTDIGSGTISKQTQMHKGFVILGINDIPIKSTTDLETAIAGNSNLQISGFYPGMQGMYYYTLSNVNGISE